jgi:hypothetical protein
MSPEPPPPSEGSSLPPRHRPSLGNHAKDTTEIDLWAFDEADSPEDSSQTVVPLVPAPRPLDKLKVRQLTDSSPPKRAADQERAPTNITKIRPKSATAGTSSGPSKRSDDFDELDHWDENQPADEIEDLPEEPELDLPKAPETAVQPPPPPAPPANDSEEFSPPSRDNASPASLAPRLNLTKVERIGLIALLVVLVAGAISAVVFSIGRLPTESAHAKSRDFPIKGRYFKIASAETFWRVPVTEGKSPDVFRRGTALLPVIQLTVRDGTGALRVIFRDSDGESIGDSVTRAVRDGQALEVAATAGFDDVGMHAAYRTGESKPWTVEVLEGPTADAPITSFTTLFQTNVSTDRR